MMKKMIEFRRLARHARCEIKRWRVTELEAWQIAEEIRWMTSERKTLRELVEEMKCGQIMLFGAMVVVR